VKTTPVRRAAAALAGLALAAVCACNRTPEKADTREQAAPRAEEAEPAPSVAPALAPAAVKKNVKEPGITWKEPAGWTKVPQRSPMRLATYRVPRAGSDAEDAELALFHFGSNSGGGIDANMTRWAGQFSDVKPEEIRRSERTANHLTQHVMEIEKGTFATGMPMGPKKPKANSGMLAAIVETPTGLYFIKLTGPSGTVKAARADFFTLLDGVRATDP
jgi:hypothetical protein